MDNDIVTSAPDMHADAHADERACGCHGYRISYYRKAS